MTTRKELIQRAVNLRNEIEQIFTDCDVWNTHTRKLDEAPIDADPHGDLRRIVNGLDRMLKNEEAGRAERGGAR